VNSILPLIVFGLAVIAGYFTAWLISTWPGAPAGVSVDSALSLFYNAKNNEATSLTVGLHDEASNINATGFYLGRKAEYAAMNFLNNTLYPTWPKWQVFGYSSLGNMNQSITNEIGLTYLVWMNNYDSAISDAVRFAQQSFVGPLAGLDLQFNSTSVKTGANDFYLMQYQVIPSYSEAYDINASLGYLIVPSGSTCNIAMSVITGVGWHGHIYLIDQIGTNDTAITGTSGTTTVWSVTPGVYEMIECPHADSMTIGTDGLMVDTTPGAWLTGMISPSRNALYMTMNFKDTSAHTYTIDVTNTTQVDPDSIRFALDITQNFANSLANAYWTTLRNAGIYSASQIPANMVIPPPDIIFLTNDDLSQLTSPEIMAMYLAYLKALGNFYNSSTYTTITTFSTANVTFANEAVIVNASFLNPYQNITWTEGDLYVQVYQDMHLGLGLNLLNSSGLLYNLNDTTCWSYASGDYLNISHIYVRANGTYVEVNETDITALSIDAYIYNSTSGPPLVPTGSAGSGSGSSGLLLILIAIVILMVISRGSGSRGNQGTTINVKRQSAIKPQIPLFFNFMNTDGAR
jgi:hypothetical protein